jgi:hypothetical protein
MPRFGGVSSNCQPSGISNGTSPGCTQPSIKASGAQSDKLSQQRGTLQPPAIDPGIHKPPPQRGEVNMPVIPPPGTPGGNQQVVPK